MNRPARVETSPGTERRVSAPTSYKTPGSTSSDASEKLSSCSCK